LEDIHLFENATTKIGAMLGKINEMGASFLAALHDGDLVGDELCDAKYVNNPGGNAHADTW